MCTDKASGKDLDRPKAQMSSGFPDVYRKWKDGDITAKEVMRQLNLSSSTFYRMAAAQEKKE